MLRNETLNLLAFQTVVMGTCCDNKTPLEGAITSLKLELFSGDKILFKRRHFDVEAMEECTKISNGKQS